jgi:DNA-binding transcriptional LysR family regulator
VSADAPKYEAIRRNDDAVTAVLTRALDAHPALPLEPRLVGGTDGLNIGVGPAPRLMPDVQHVGLLAVQLAVLLLRHWPRPWSTVRPSGKRGVTSAFKKAVQSSSEIVGQIDALARDTQGQDREVSGMLRLALLGMLGQIMIAPLLPVFMRRHPALRLDVRFDESFADLGGGALDVAIRIGALEAGGDVIVRKLAVNQRLICASPRYVAARGAPRSPTDLATHAILQFSRFHGGRRWRIAQADGPIQEVEVDPVITADNAEALRQAALAGLGIANLARYVVDEDIRTGRLIEVMQPFAPAESTISLVYPETRFVPAKTRAFADFMIEALQMPGSA